MFIVTSLERYIFRCKTDTKIYNKNTESQKKNNWHLTRSYIFKTYSSSAHVAYGANKTDKKNFIIKQTQVHQFAFGQG